VTISGKLARLTVDAASGQEVTIYPAQGRHAFAHPGGRRRCHPEKRWLLRIPQRRPGRENRFVVRSASAAPKARVVVLVYADVTLHAPVANGATLAIAGARASGVPDRLRFFGVVKRDSALIELRVREAAGSRVQ
jgi:hypothetical protein